MSNTANETRRITMRKDERKRQEIGSALLFLALFVTFEILPSTRAAPINSRKNTAVHSKEAEEDVIPEEVTYNRTSETSKNCAELYKSGQRISGVYTIDPDGSGAFNVSCDQTTSGGGWTVFQKRMDGSVDFNRTWDDYKYGFGNFIGEFWLGLDKINRLTRSKTNNMLRVDLGIKTGKTVHAEYDWFGIGNETAKYRLFIGKETNETVISDSLGGHRDFSFGTWDRDPYNCDEKRGGGWWYTDANCAVWSNLNGLYFDNKTSRAIYWSNLGTIPQESIPKSAEMKIRPVDFVSSF